MDLKKILNWRTGLGVVLVVLSAIFYYIHFVIFHDAHHIFIYLWGDIAFVPIEVLVVTLIIHHLLEKRAKKDMLNKMNMLIGAFFSETGTQLLKSFADLDPEISSLRKSLDFDGKWKEEDFSRIDRVLRSHDYRCVAEGEDFNKLRDFLKNKKGFLLNLLANPNLLEHESFTEVLWAVFHFAEEIEKRDDFLSMPDADMDHLRGDVKRAYRALALEWVRYMHHLKSNYPYLFSLALRTNPFSAQASVVFTK